MKLALALALAALPLAAAHSSLIKPKPRNAIDSELPEWEDGKSPYYWVKGIGKDGAPCACRNGSSACASAQTCLWFSVGCSLGCAECDGGAKGPGNPNKIDRCGANFTATNNDPRSRTINRGAVAGSEADWTKYNPWRAPGHAPIYDPWCVPFPPLPVGQAFIVSPFQQHLISNELNSCHRSIAAQHHAASLAPPLRSGRASGGPHATSGKGEFTNTTFAKLGDLGSRVLPKYDTGTVWELGSTVETMTSFRAVHGGSQPAP
jgi:hypothetical protein